MKNILFIPLFLLVSCSSTPPLELQSSNFVPKTMSVTYRASYDYVWKVTLSEMQRFPLKVINKDAGTIVSSPSFRISSHHRDKINEYIDVKIVALSPVDNIPQTRVEITKFARTEPPMGSPIPVPSNLIEEQVIHHRIARMLEIEREKLERGLN